MYIKFPFNAITTKLNRFIYMYDILLILIETKGHNSLELDLRWMSADTEIHPISPLTLVYERFICLRVGPHSEVM